MKRRRPSRRSPRGQKKFKNVGTDLAHTVKQSGFEFGVRDGRFSQERSSAYEGFPIPD